MKVTLEYDPENFDDKEEALIILYARKNQIIVDELYDKLIHPFHKHGYQDRKVNEILEKLGPDGEYLVEYFNSILKELVGND